MKKHPWCKHISFCSSQPYSIFNKKGKWTTPYWSHDYMVVPNNWKMCPICGAKKPSAEMRRKLIAETGKASNDELTHRASKP